MTAYTNDPNNRMTVAGGSSYTYDANGNLTAISTGQSFGYDALNRLTQATGPGGVATYTYNGAGLKTQRTGPDGVTRYYYDGIKPIWETDGVGVMTAQLDRDIFGNLLSRVQGTGTRRYYHPDGLGSTVALTDVSGAVTASLLYDAWGNLRASGGAAPGKYQFTGAELDPTTGLYQMGNRFYDPTIGRWLSEDKAHNQFDPSSLNYYAYVNNNPLVLIDPDGQVAIVAALVLGAAGIGISPLVGGFIIATGIGVGVGYLVGSTINFLSRKKLEGEVKTRANTLAKHLANLSGQSVAGRPPDPNFQRDPRRRDSYKREIEKLLNNLSETVEGNLDELKEIMRDRMWMKDSEIAEFFKSVKDAGIDVSLYFK